MKNLTKRILSTLFVLVLILSFSTASLSSFAASANTPTTASWFNDNKIVLKANQSITYNQSEDVMKQEIFDTVVDHEQSVLPENTKWDDLSYLIMDSDVGTTTVYICYGYDITSYESVSIEITKASMKVDIPFFKSIYCDEKLTNYVTVTPDDDAIYAYTLFAGINSSANVGLYVNLPTQISSVISNEYVGTVWSWIDEDGYTLEERLAEGMTVKQFKDFLSNETFLGALEFVGVDTSGFRSVLNVLNSDLVSYIIDDSRVAIGVPNRAGAYAVVALGSDSNYETAMDYGTFVVKKRWGATLQWKDNDPLKGAAVLYNGTAGHIQDGVKVIYSGLTSAKKPYVSTKAPTEAGNYVATAFLAGGNYMALPLVQTFTIS